MSGLKQYFDGERRVVEKMVGESLGIDIKKDVDTILVDLDDYSNDGDDGIVKESVERGKQLWAENVDKLLMWILLLIAVAGEVYFIKQFALAFYSFDRSYIDNVIIYIPVLLPVAYFLTLNERFNYLDFKMLFYKLGLFSAVIKILGFFYFFVSDFNSSIVLFVNTFNSFPQKRIVMLGYALNGFAIALAALLIYRIFEEGYEAVCDRFESYKLGKELRPKISKHEYSSGFIKNLDSRKLIRIPEKDRMLHLGIIGATGSGKTATVILPLVFEDIKKKFKNSNYVKKAAFKMVKKGLFDVIELFDDKSFSMAKILPVEGDKRANKVYDKLNKLRPCGITVVGPDDSLSNQVYDMAKLFNFNVRRIDPLPDENGRYKEGYIGVNPLHVSETTPEWAIDRERIKRATLFADVMQFIYEMKGKSDPYFSSINRVGTTYISLLLMITMPIIDGRQPNPVDVQRLLNNFDLIGAYYQRLRKLSEKNNDKYGIICDAIHRDFISEGGRKVFEQHSRGLKTQLNEFLTDTLITDLFTADEVIDFDKVLRDGDITVVNIELGQLGSVNSPALGLFISMLMNNAVLSRPGDERTRIPHFLYYDEFPVFASPALEGAFTLYRKFGVGLTIAMQTTDQMNRTPYLSYMKGVILNSCRSLVFFGGANVSDMELVNKLAGKVGDTMSQKTTSHSSLSVENPYITFSDRVTAVDADRVSATDVRYADFKEVHYFYTIDGNPMPVIKGKLEFVKKSELHKRRNVEYDFMQFYDEGKSGNIEDEVGASEIVNNADVSEVGATGGTQNEKGVDIVETEEKKEREGRREKEERIVIPDDMSPFSATQDVVEGSEHEIAAQGKRGIVKNEKSTNSEKTIVEENSEDKKVKKNMELIGKAQFKEE